MRGGSVVLLASVASLLCSSAWAQPVSTPALINQEGVLLGTDGFPIDTGDDELVLTFRLYDSLEGGAPLFQEEHRVSVQSGYYAVVLGSRDPHGNPLTVEVFDRPEVYLAIQVGDDPEMEPRHRMTSMPYALRAQDAVNVSGDITPSSVSTTGALSASSGTILDGFTVNGGLTAGSVQSGAVTASGNLQVDGTIHGDLAAGTVETEDLQDGSVTAAKLGTGSVDSAAIVDGTITSDDLRNGEVHIADVGQDVWDAFGDAAGREGGGGGGGGLVVDADTVDGVDSTSFLRSDQSDVASGALVSFLGRIVASQGDDGNHGISFQGVGADRAAVEYDADQPDSVLRIGNYGGPGDSVALTGATITLDGDMAEVMGTADVASDLFVGRDTSAVGNATVGGWGSFGGDLRVGGTTTALGSVDAQLDLTVGTTLHVVQDATVDRDLLVRGNAQVVGRLAVQGPVIVDGGAGAVTDVVVRHGNVLTENGGDVDADGAGRGTTLGAAGGYIQPETGRGKGVSFPGAPFDGNDRAWLYHYQVSGAAGALELGVGNDTNDRLILKSGGGTQVRSSRTDNGLGERGADLDVGRNLLVRGTSRFQQSIDVAGNVVATTVQAGTVVADSLDLGDDITVGTLRVLNSLSVSDGEGGGIFHADQISGGLADGIVTANTIDDGAVTGDKIASGAVHGGHISDGTIGTLDLGVGVVNSSIIADDSVTGADLADGAVTALSIGDDQILTRHIKDGEVQAGDVAAGEGLTKAIGKARVKARRRDQIEAAALLCHALP